MAAPVAKKVKRLARFVLGKPRVVNVYDLQKDDNEIWGFSDSDWAGCRRTAKSTSGGVIMRGQHLIKSWSATQKSVTLSSAEAELVAAVKMTTEAIGVAQLVKDWGIIADVRVYVDSSAAIGVASRKGNGKLRHVKVGMMWIQEKVEDKDISLIKVLGENNPADLMTKHLDQKKRERFVQMCGQRYREGKADKSLDLDG